MLKTIFFDPLYNLLVLLTNLLPGGDLGLAIIILTVLVKVIIFPLYRKSLETQMRMREIEPLINEIKQKYSHDKTTQAQKTMEVYQQNKINPFSGILVLLIQFPIVIALFYLFKDNLSAHLSSLYSFIHFPELVNESFLGLINLNQRSYLLAILTGLTQYWQTSISLPKTTKPNKPLGENSFKEDLLHSMNLQMRYGMPIFIVFIAITLPAAVSLYWVTSNIISSLMELYLKKQRRKV